jgi:hypothetical protein
MDEDFYKIIELFSLESTEKEKRIDEIFRLSMNFIDKFKDIQAHGDAKEREVSLQRMTILKEKISAEKNRSQQELSLSSEEITELSSDEKNFSKEQWELLQKTKASIKEEQELIAKNKKNVTDQRLSKMASTGKKQRSTKRSKSSWLKS